MDDKSPRGARFQHGSFTRVSINDINGDTPLMRALNYNKLSFAARENIFRRKTRGADDSGYAGNGVYE